MAGIGLDPGTIVGRDFRVLRHLASGAMGAVYVVEQLSTGKQRAMKVMAPELAESDRARDRFVLEARVGARIDSDHVVEVVTAGIDDATGMPFLVMELLKGEDLGALVERRGPLPLRDVAEILKQAGHALEQAHAQGIVHRDLKPENLFLAESRREGVPFTVKILDFGIAKLVAERGGAGTQAIGTPLFMAPEQTERRGHVSPASDVWPLGLIAFYLLTGQIYWQTAASGITTLLREVVIEELEPASSRARAYGLEQLLPPGFDGWFARCVTRDAAARFPEAGQAVRAFEQLVLADAPPGMLTWPEMRSGTVADSGQVTRSVVSISGPQEADGVGATVLADPAPLPGTAAGTGLTSASSMPTAPQRSRAGLWIGGLFLVAAGGAAAWVLANREQDVPEEPAPPAASSASASASAPLAEAPPCPEGMILVPGGNMFMGSTDADLADDVRPPHKVRVSDFCFDRTEVTAGAYDACAKSGNCLRAPSEVKYPGATPADIAAHSALCNTGQADRAEHPINCIDWNMASAFCSAEGGRLPKGGARLPTEAEWEYAARGSGQRIYPWGDQPPAPELLNACGGECVSWLKSSDLQVYGSMFEGDDGHAATAPVGSYPKGASSAGVLDLAGNVWEWTADWYGPYQAEEAVDPKGPAEGTERVVRGGGFNGIKPAWLKPAYRWKATPDWRSDGIGFRCAAEPRR